MYQSIRTILPFSFSHFLILVFLIFIILVLAHYLRFIVEKPGCVMELFHALGAADLPGAWRNKQGITSHLMSVKRAADLVSKGNFETSYTFTLDLTK